MVIPNIGPGFTVTNQGPLSSNLVATSSPDPTASARALSRLSHSGAISTYERVWQDAGQNNAVQDLVVRFSTTTGARVFEASVEHSLATGEVVTAAPLAAIPGAFRATYFATTTKVGVGQAIAMRSGDYVAVLSFFSTNAATNTLLITPSDAVRVARAQHASLVTANAVNSSPAHSAVKKASGTSSLLVMAVIVVLAIIFFLISRRWFVRALGQPQPDPTQAATVEQPTTPADRPPEVIPSAPSVGRSARERSGVWADNDEVRSPGS